VLEDKVVTMGFERKWMGSRDEVASPPCLPPDVELSIISTASSSYELTSSRHNASKESLHIADFDLSTEDIPECSRVGKAIKTFEKLRKKCNDSSRAVGRNVVSPYAKERKHEFTPSQMKTNAVATQPHASSDPGQEDPDSHCEAWTRTSPFVKARSLDKQARRSIMQRLRERKKRNEEAVSKRIQQMQVSRKSSTSNRLQLVMFDSYTHVLPSLFPIATPTIW